VQLAYAAGLSKKAGVCFPSNEALFPRLESSESAKGTVLTLWDSGGATSSLIKIDVEISG
jgi:hypothetical protein